MNKEDQREIRRRKRVLDHAKQTGCVIKTCRYFNIPKSSFYRWRKLYNSGGEAELANKKRTPKSHPNATPAPVIEKILHLRRIYHLGPIRIVWYLQRYHDIRVCDATVYRMIICGYNESNFAFKSICAYTPTHLL